MPNLAAARRVGDITFVVEVWELQRRVTLFHSSWRAPFLPHDATCQWRWVVLGNHYQQHEWVEGTRESCAASEAPPIRPPLGWRAGQWFVSRAPGDCDEAGWQYAHDFYVGSHHWGGSITAMHVRRRLWCCFIERTDEAVDADVDVGGVGPLRRSMSRGFVHSMHMTTVLQDSVPWFCLAQELGSIFAEEWKPGCLIVDILMGQDARDIEVGPWLQQEAGGDDSKPWWKGVRELTMEVPVVPESSFSPSSTRAAATYLIWAERKGGDTSISITSSLAFLGLPYQDYFSVQGELSLRPSGGGIAVNKSFAVVFSHSTIFQSTIERGTKQGQEITGEANMAVLRARSQNLPPKTLSEHVLQGG